MTNSFNRPALVCNLRSGSSDEALVGRLIEICDAAGAPLVRTMILPDDDLPSAAALEGDGIDLLLVLSGDGTLNAAAGALETWSGAMLPLPGGTLNLFHKTLHGDRGPEDILHDALAGKARRVHPPTIFCDAGRAYIGVIAGPTTAWAEVREQFRSLSLSGLAETIPDAIDATLHGDGVRILGSDESFQAINLTPKPDRIIAEGLITDSAGSILSHGIAWLGGDFREGPSVDLSERRAVVIEGKGSIGLLLDGEPAELPSGATYRLEASPLAFLATAPAAS
ncbi:diacylglycerol kinase family protein [Sphingopyxis sp.]|uniref:diacylglycerol/lipid kinase family protein n=1 Tax=Sphingopyxis sp. TaxID=1908224 RepID=UPI0010FA1EAA|nr:diacylglycerol kinase family protein [Sphingopyxis sp.]MBR2171000.1 sphingosine kinase [Sphingopyxis sp.]